MKNNKIKRIEARVPALIKTKLEEIARITGRTQSKVLTDLIETEYDRLGEDEE